MSSSVPGQRSAEAHINQDLPAVPGEAEFGIWMLVGVSAQRDETQGMRACQKNRNRTEIATTAQRRVEGADVVLSLVPGCSARTRLRCPMLVGRAHGISKPMHRGGPLRFLCQASSVVANRRLERCRDVVHGEKRGRHLKEKNCRGESRDVFSG